MATARYPKRLRGRVRERRCANCGKSMVFGQTARAPPGQRGEVHVDGWFHPTPRVVNGRARVFYDRECYFNIPGSPVATPELRGPPPTEGA